MGGGLGGDGVWTKACGAWLGGGGGWASCGEVEGEDSSNAAQQNRQAELVAIWAVGLCSGLRGKWSGEVAPWYVGVGSGWVVAMGLVMRYGLVRV